MGERGSCFTYFKYTDSTLGQARHGAAMSAFYKPLAQPQPQPQRTTVGYLFWVKFISKCIPFMTLTAPVFVKDCPTIN